MRWVDGASQCGVAIDGLSFKEMKWLKNENSLIGYYWKLVFIHWPSNTTQNQFTIHRHHLKSCRLPLGEKYFPNPEATPLGQRAGKADGSSNVDWVKLLFLALGNGSMRKRAMGIWHHSLHDRSR